MKLKFIALFTVALVAMALVLAYYPAVQKSIAPQQPPLPKEQLDAYDSFALTYKDPLLGFSLSYPKGYVAQSQEGQAFVFYSPAPSGMSESFIVSVMNDTPSQGELESALGDFDVRKVSETSVAVNGQQVKRYEYLVSTGAEDLHVVQSLLPCANYSLYYLATIPDSVKEDLGLADYVLGSISC